MKQNKPLSYIHYNSPTDNLARIPIHLRSIHHQTPLVAARPAHQPLPQDAVNAVHDHGKHVTPRRVGYKIPGQAAAGTRQEALVGDLHLVKVDGFFAVGTVAVAKDVKAGFYAPYFTEEGGATDIKIQMVFLRAFSVWRFFPLVDVLYICIHPFGIPGKKKETEKEKGWIDC